MAAENLEFFLEILNIGATDSHALPAQGIWNTNQNL